MGFMTDKQKQVSPADACKYYEKRNVGAEVEVHRASIKYIIRPV